MTIGSNLRPCPQHQTRCILPDLEPRDMDTLSVAAAVQKGRSPVLLRESLETVLCDETDHGAFIVGAAGSARSHAFRLRRSPT